MATAIVKKLTIKKEMIIKSVSQIEDYLNKLNNQLTAAEIAGIEMRVEMFRPKYAQLQDIAVELAAVDIDITEEVYAFETKYMEVLLAATTRLPRAQANAHETAITTPTPEVRLPVIEIPAFNGNYENWTRFSDCFVSLIHDNKSLTNVQKFHYLQGALKGEAATILKCVKVSDVGYELAWNRLKDRYQNERFIFKKHMQTLLNLPHMKKDDHASLRHLMDTLAINISSLKAIKRATEHYDDFIVELVPEKLDINLRKEWEGRTCDHIPTVAELETFLSSKCKQLEAIKDNCFGVSVSSGSHKAKVLHTNTFERKCLFCNGSHAIYKCDKFAKLTVSERINAVKRNNMCYNCLGKNHTANNCSSSSCRVCKKSHHTMLHIPQNTNSLEPIISPVSVINPSSSTVNFAYMPSNILLSTCVVLIEDIRGHKQKVRALLDTGAQANLITGSCAKRLGLRHINTNVPIVGVGGNTTAINQVVNTKINSRLSTFNLSVSALVIEKITDVIPSRKLQFDLSRIPPQIQLADPEFYEPSEIDLLIGNGHYQDIICDGRLTVNKLSFYNTHFGWVMYGQYPNKRDNKMDNTIVSIVGLNEIVSKFWELEGYKNESLTPADERCEKHFQSHVKRDNTGRFEVALPLKDDPSQLGDSSESSKRKFFALERRLAKSPDTYDEYRAFMQEYIELGHMKKTTGDVRSGYYLPHHCVMKRDSLTTKLRVVFNGSAPTSTGKSLNDMLMVGPTVQNDLFSIMVRMRSWKYVITADIAKMYRQVKVRCEDAKYQRIWWRSSPEEHLTSYELTTVTYGTSSAAFLAIRALHELANIMCDEYPIGSQKCLSDFYVDDLITGAHTLNELIQVRDQVNSLLASGGFELKRWASNNRELFNNFKPDCVDDITVLTRDNGAYTDSVTTLGTIWSTVSDTLSYKYYVVPSRANTKRQILSEISRVYDPLGLIGPIIIVGKIIIQDLWKLKCGWDDALPDTHIQRWLEYAENLEQVSTISIPRNVADGNNLEFELHGFADASEHAYGACVYVVGVREGNRLFSNLLCAKSRVAPVKATSIPRLELCAAVLLAELCKRVTDALHHQRYTCFYYSDSTITLSWIKSDSRRFKTFIANRIGTIHQLSNPDAWFHVATKENPADLISRGTTAEIVKNSHLWWRGPAFLLHDIPSKEFIPAECPPELKCNLLCTTNSDIIIPKCSSFEKTVRVMAYALRFKTNFIARRVLRYGPLSTVDLNEATTFIIRAVQCASFKREREQLLKDEHVHQSSTLITLNPFLDSDGLIRVGGRLVNTDLTINRRCPIVLPASHELTKLIALSVHRTNLHIGAQGTLAAMRQKFWPIHGRKLVRGVIRGCIQCIKAKPRFEAPMMGALPEYRTQPCRPFLRSGVDYAGPFTIKEGSRRSKKTIKAYICIFVCFATKAVHIEMASNLTTECFMAALHRFISRRGHVSEIFSDNGTNFIGARNHLRKVGLFLRNEDNADAIFTQLSQRQIKWSFIPPRAPHFGGLWEAAVKNVKTHLRRVAGKALLTAEEFNTVLIQIEAVLNSRPLCPLTNDPNDCNVLTPAHFLIGDVLTAPVDVDFQDTADNRLSRWELVQKIRQQIWKRWSREYLSELHTRTKWKTKGNLLHIGQLVIIKDDNLPPLQWQLGRIQSLNVGPDGIPRSATIKTSATTIVRPVIKLCPLPIDN